LGVAGEAGVGAGVTVVGALDEVVAFDRVQTVAMVRLCFVCLGNICRSPTAEGVMRKLVADVGLTDRIDIDSAGTGAWHVGDRADARSADEARRRGIDLTSRARQFHPGDLYVFDLVLAMDRSNLAHLHDMAPEAELRDKIHLLRAFAPLAPADRAVGASAGTVGHPDAETNRGGPDLDVPDPYYGGPTGFADVFDLVDVACRGLLDHVRRTYAL